MCNEKNVCQGKRLLQNGKMHLNESPMKGRGKVLIGTTGAICLEREELLLNCLLQKSSPWQLYKVIMKYNSWLCPGHTWQAEPWHASKPHKCTVLKASYTVNKCSASFLHTVLLGLLVLSAAPSYSSPGVLPHTAQPVPLNPDPPPLPTLIYTELY